MTESEKKQAEAVELLLGQYRLLFAPDQVVELRAVGVRRGQGRPHVESGYFAAGSLGDLLRAALGVTRSAKGVYVTLNPVRPDLLARRANRLDWAAEGELTRDKDVLSRRWLLIDADPVRDPLVSATDAEKAAARAAAEAVRDFLRGRGWPEPLLADSGNGYHLLVRIDLPAADGGLVQAVIEALAGRFDTGAVKIDRQVFNAARLCKLPGTLARKGDHTDDRPHRRASLLEGPAGGEVAVAPRELLEALVSDLSPPAAAPAAPAGPAAPPSGRYSSRLLVEDWLRDRGVAYRRKPEADGLGRDVWVLKECPFDPTHQDPDSCVMQAPDGRLSAKCFHNGCSGRGWRDFKAAIGAPDPRHYDPPLLRRAPGGRAELAIFSPPDDPPTEEGDAAPTGPPGLPRIQMNDRQLRDVTADALEALLAHNEPPTVFRRGGLLTRLRPGEEGDPPQLEPLSDPALRGVLARAADWFRLFEGQEGPVEREDAPSSEAVKDLACLPGWEGVPPLDTVVECPVFSRSGALVQTPGYHREARLWYHPQAGLHVPEVSAVPSPEEVGLARSLLLDDLLGDFPFADGPSRTHALAALLLPFLRAAIDGPTPLHLLDAPVEGTGKTLLATVIGLVSTGREPEAMAEASCDEEWRKRITAVLAEGPTFVLLDNLNRTLDSGALASVLTCRVWKDRLLGVSKTARLPNRAVWLASGNNTKLSRELIRRTLWCRLDARVDAPWERAEFRHPNLVGWARANRGALVHAALTLCQAWVAAGRPAGQQTLGMFEGWAEAVGGVLEVAGVPGLLGNASQFRAARADQVAEWRAFVASWWQEHADAEVGVDQLYALATRDKLLDQVLGDKGERSQRTRLGFALGKAVDRVVGDLRVVPAEDDHKGRQRFRLAQLGSGPDHEAGRDD